MNTFCTVDKKKTGEEKNKEYIGVFEGYQGGVSYPKKVPVMKAKTLNYYAIIILSLSRINVSHLSASLLIRELQPPVPLRELRL